jgi:hypothetical protein
MPTAVTNAVGGRQAATKRYVEEVYELRESREHKKGGQNYYNESPWHAKA